MRLTKEQQESYTMKKALAFILATTLCLAMLASCNKTSSPPTTETIDKSVTITDVIGRTVTLPEPAKAVVGTHNPTLNQLIILGGGGKYIIGFGNKNMAGELYKYVYPELQNNVEQIGMGRNINMETVLLLNPDLAILPERMADLVPMFEDVGVPVAVVLPNTESFDTIKESLLRVATLVGATDKANEIIAFFEAKTAELKGVVANATNRPSILFLGGSSWLTVANGDMLQSVMIETVGGINPAKSVQGRGDFAEVTTEQIIAWNPDVIYIPAYASYTVESILTNPALSSIQAIKDGKVFKVPCLLEPWDYPTPSICLGLAWCVNNLYPNLYSQSQVIKDAQDYYRLVYGMSFTAEQLGLN